MLSKEQCDTVISYSEIFEQNHISKIAVYDNLDYYYYFIERNDTTQWLFDFMSNHLKTRFPNNKISEKESFNLQMYTPGNVFLKHVDSDRNPDHLHVFGVILNDDYEGGKFIFDSPVEEVPKVTGHIFDFNTDRPHEVTKVESGVRWTLIGFLTKEDLNIKPSIL